MDEKAIGAIQGRVGKQPEEFALRETIGEDPSVRSGWMKSILFGGAEDCASRLGDRRVTPATGVERIDGFSDLKGNSGSNHKSLDGRSTEHRS